MVVCVYPSIMNQEEKEVITVKCGCIAQSVNDCKDAWIQIGTNYVVSRSLINTIEKETNTEINSFTR